MISNQLARVISMEIICVFFSVINISCKYKRVLITFYAMVASYCQSISGKWYVIRV